jgi:hypothetical protein
MVTARKRSAHKALSPMPLGELPIMRALLAVPAPSARGTTTRKRAIKGDPKKELRTLTLTIVNKIQVLALRRPRALIVVARVLDTLLDQQLKLLLDTKPGARGPRKTS